MGTILDTKLLVFLGEHFCFAFFLAGLVGLTLAGLAAGCRLPSRGGVWLGTGRFVHMCEADRTFGFVCPFRCMA